MPQAPLYCYRKSRLEQSRKFITMGLFCWGYVIALLLFEHLSATRVPEAFRWATLLAFPFSSLVLFWVAYWHRQHPATYELIVTNENLSVNYPGSDRWSFDIKLADIERFESRQTLGPGGEGIMRTGVLLKDGDFVELCMNYGVNVREVYRVVQSLHPKVSFPSKVNIKASGLGIDRDYKN